MTDRLRAVYEIETSLSLDEAVATMAGEQSTGTFVRLAAETDDFLLAHAARVERIDPLEERDFPSLSGAHSRPGPDGRVVWRRAQVELSWPFANIGAHLPNAFATVGGNLYELKPFSGLKLMDVSFPPAFVEKYKGPRFGIAGTRHLAGVADRPLIGTIIKPSVGLSPQQSADQVDQLCAAGIDFIKDDELQGDSPHCPFAERVRAVMSAIDRHADRLGRKPMFAFNITGDPNEMRRRHDQAVEAGATCVMVSLNAVGLSGMIDIAQHTTVPIHAHRNGWGYLSRHESLGFDYRAWQKFWRLAGADHMHVNGLRNKFCETDSSVITSARECLSPMFDPPSPDCRVMPVFSSGQSADQAWDTFEALGSTDLIHAAGGGITAHPDGLGAGVKSMATAWDAAVSGLSRAEAAAAEPALARALEFFAKR